MFPGFIQSLAGIGYICLEQMSWYIKPLKLNSTDSIWFCTALQSSRYAPTVEAKAVQRSNNVRVENKDKCSEGNKVFS